MKAITLLGSTGSIGTQTLEIVAQYPDQFQIVGLAARRNVELLAVQIQQFRPAIVAIANESELSTLKAAIADLNPQPILVTGKAGIADVARYGEAETVVTGIVGYAGLLPTIAAIEAGKNIALANKETLIAGGPIILPLVQKHGVKLLPADSEHSAIFQCLQGIPEGGLRRILPQLQEEPFGTGPVEKLAEVTVADALKHPNWSMGRKITVDSATLMNKGLEVIEAHYLFGLDYDQIEIVIHPQSIIHSLIELQDTSVLAQLGWPDMRLPLLYALSWPERIYTDWEPLDLIKAGTLTFQEPNHAKYPCMQLAYAAGRAGGAMPAVLNAANEQAVALFLEEKIRFLDIPRLIDKACDRYQSHNCSNPSLEDIIAADQCARQEVLAASQKGTPCHFLKMPRGKYYSNVNYRTYIRSRKWYGQHKQWLRATGYSCALLPWVKVGRGHPYRIHHLHYGNLGNEKLGRDVIPLCPFAHDQIIHGILSGFKSAGQQRNYPNFSQRLVHAWCRQRLWFKRVILIGDYLG